MKKQEKSKDDLLISLSNEKKIYIESIKNGSYKEKYENILELIKIISKNIESADINQLIDTIKQYINLNEDEPLNKIKVIILEYNGNIQKIKSIDNSTKPIIDEVLFLNQIILELNDLIGCHVYYFISKMFEYCEILNFKIKYHSMKEDLLKNIQNLEEEFLKMKKENEIKEDLKKEEKEEKMKILDEYKNRYECMINNKGRDFEFYKKIVHSGGLIDFFEFCDRNLLEFEKYENNYVELKYIFPLIYFYKTYIEEKKYNFLIYKNNIENNNSEKKFSLFKDYNLFKIKTDKEDNLDLIKEDEKEIMELLTKFENDVVEKCDLSNFVKNKLTFNSSFSFIPQIEIKFNDVKDITKDLIDDLILKLNQMFEGKDIKIVEMKKGSLDLAIALNYLIQEAFNDINLNNISSDKFLEILNQTLNIKTGNIKNILQDNLVIAQQDKQFKPDFINQNLLDLTTEESKDKLSKTIKEHFSQNDNQNNIFEVAQNITPSDIKSFYEKLFQETKSQQNDLCDIILNNEFQEYLRAFESEFEKALRNSIFEYNTKFITYIYRNDEAYRAGKLHCNNLNTKFVFHGTRSWCISRILSGNFCHANVHFFGIGAYFTDLLDYAWFYAAETDGQKGKFKNVSRIPQLKESFSLIASEIYFDKSKFEQVYDMAKENQTVPKNGIRHVCVNFGGNEIPKKLLKNYNGFIGTEYIITEKEQILPLLNITLERVEFLIVWRDNNFNISNPNGYDHFKEMYDFNIKIKKYAGFNLKTKIYYFNETNEALTFIKRKKFNKIILISNGGNNGIGFIKEARKIIGSNTISLITCYVVENYMDVAKKTENLLLSSKYYNCIKDFLNFSTTKNIDELKNLQKNVENSLKNIDNSFSFKKINNDVFNFPYFKSGGNFSEIKF